MKNYISILILSFAIFFISNCTKADTNNNNFVFLSNRESPKGEFDIFISDLYDTSQINLTQNIEFIRSISKPLLSFKKEFVLYISFDRRLKSIHIIDLKNKKDMYLSNVNMDNPDASFIDNDNKVLFTKKINGIKQLFTINVNGQREENISYSINNEFNAPVSYDNRTMSFLRKVKNKTFIVIRDMITKNEDSIQVNGDRVNPAFANDNKIVYESFVKGSYKVFVYDIISKHIEQITTGDANAHDPVFVNEGKSLLFITDGRGKKYRDICVLNLKTKKYKFLTSDLNMINQNYSLSRDKNKIIFESSQFNNSDIYFLKLNDKKIINLSRNSAWDCNPSFQ